MIKGVDHTYKNKGKHIITSKIEQPAILNPCKFLESQGYSISYAPVDSHGRVAPKDIEKLSTDQTILVTFIHSNNETGTIQLIEDIEKVCRRHKVLFSLRPSP